MRLMIVLRHGLQGLRGFLFCPCEIPVIRT